MTDMTRAEAVEWARDMEQWYSITSDESILIASTDPDTYRSIAAMLERDGRKADAFDAIAEGDLNIAIEKAGHRRTHVGVCVWKVGSVLPAQRYADHPDKPSALLSAVEQALGADHE